MAKRGRKRVAEDQRRKHAVTCRLTDAEAGFVDRYRGSITRGEYIRLSALDKVPARVPEINRQVWTKLSGLAANLNQVMTLVNMEKIDTDVGKIQVREIWETVKQLRADLRGERI